MNELTQVLTGKRKEAPTVLQFKHNTKADAIDTARHKILVSGFLCLLTGTFMAGKSVGIPATGMLTMMALSGHEIVDCIQWWAQSGAKGPADKLKLQLATIPKMIGCLCQASPHTALVGFSLRCFAEAFYKQVLANRSLNTHG